MDDSQEDYLHADSSKVPAAADKTNGFFHTSRFYDSPEYFDERLSPIGKPLFKNSNINNNMSSNHEADTIVNNDNHHNQGIVAGTTSPMNYLTDEIDDYSIAKTILKSCNLTNKLTNGNIPSRDYYHYNCNNSTPVLKETSLPIDLNSGSLSNFVSPNSQNSNSNYNSNGYHNPNFLKFDKDNFEDIDFTETEEEEDGEFYIDSGSSERSNHKPPNAADINYDDRYSYDAVNYKISKSTSSSSDVFVSDNSEEKTTTVTNNYLPPVFEHKPASRIQNLMTPLLYNNNHNHHPASSDYSTYSSSSYNSYNSYNNYNGNVKSDSPPIMINPIDSDKLKRESSSNENSNLGNYLDILNTTIASKAIPVLEIPIKVTMSPRCSLLTTAAVVTSTTTTLCNTLPKAAIAKVSLTPKSWALKLSLNLCFQSENFKSFTALISEYKKSISASALPLGFGSSNNKNNNDLKNRSDLLDSRQFPDNKTPESTTDCSDIREISNKKLTDTICPLFQQVKRSNGMVLPNDSSSAHNRAHPAGSYHVTSHPSSYVPKSDQRFEHSAADHEKCLAGECNHQNSTWGFSNFSIPEKASYYINGGVKRGSQLYRNVHDTLSHTANRIESTESYRSARDFTRTRPQVTFVATVMALFTLLPLVSFLSFVVGSFCFTFFGFLLIEGTLLSIATIAAFALIGTLGSIGLAIGLFLLSAYIVTTTCLRFARSTLIPGSKKKAESLYQTFRTRVGDFGNLCNNGICPYSHSSKSPSQINGSYPSTNIASHSSNVTSPVRGGPNSNYTVYHRQQINSDRNDTNF